MFQLSLKPVFFIAKKRAYNVLLARPKRVNIFFVSFFFLVFFILVFWTPASYNRRVFIFLDNAEPNY